MRGAAADYLLLAAALLSILPIGIVIVHARGRLSGIDLLGYGAAAGVAVQAIFGIAIAVFPAARALIVLGDAATSVAAIVYVLRSGAVQDLARTVTRPLRICLLLWLLFVGICIAFTHVNVRLPAQLPDGRYVFKAATTNVRLQYLTSLPADNLIPYIVTEYLLREISFPKERPILPGNEVSNRTVLLSLAAIPYRGALSPPPRWEGPLGTFEYVGRQWPAVGRLYEEVAYRQVLVIGIFLNSLLLLGLVVLFQRQAADGILLPVSLLLACTNPYVLCQTVFIWPKALAGFFLLLAWRSLDQKHSPIVVGICTALAYHSHPYAGVFAIGIGVYYLFTWLQSLSPLRAAAVFGGTFTLCTLPWFVWTMLIIRAPSDLFWQNFAGPDAGPAMSSVVNFVWVRLTNMFDLFSPTFFGVYPFRASSVIEEAQVTLPGAVGLFVFVPAILRVVQPAHQQKFMWLAAAFPALIILLLFSYRARPIVHGYQAIVGMLLFCGVAKLRETLPARWFLVVAAAQLAVNGSLLALRVTEMGVHLP